MRLEKWALIKKRISTKTMVLPEDFKAGEYSLVGIIYGRNGFEDGGLVITSKIIKFDGKIALTHSGNLYELGQMHHDYQQFIKAWKEGVKILKCWDIDKGIIRANIFEKGNYEVKNCQIYYGEIIAQSRVNGTLIVNSKNKEEKVFVDWLDIGFETYKKMTFGQINMDEECEFCHYNVKCDLVKKHHFLMLK